MSLPRKAQGTVSIAPLRTGPANQSAVEKVFADDRYSFNRTFANRPGEPDIPMADGEEKPQFEFQSHLCEPARRTDFLLRCFAFRRVFYYAFQSHLCEPARRTFCTLKRTASKK